MTENSETEYKNPYDDPLYLSSSDFPGMQLVSTFFNGTNYLSWSRGIMLALGSKNKQGFLNGTTAKPASTSAKLQQWTRSDNMVRCWILNSIDSGIKEGFLSAKSSKILWDEIQERYGQSNGPLLFQLKKELRSVTQENRCTCNILKKLLETASKEKDGKDSKDYKIFKTDERICHHCNKKGHVKDRCFKLHPELLQQMQQQRAKLLPGGSKYSAKHVESDNFADTPMDFSSNSDSQKKIDLALVLALYQEILKMAYGSSSQNQYHNITDSVVNFASKNTVAKVFTCMSSTIGCKSHWIVDSGATDHMTYCKQLFVSYKVLPRPISVGLPDGSVKNVTLTGDIIIHPKIHLKDVLYLPDFKHNLLSVQRLLSTTGHAMLFDAKTCMLQDHVTKQVIAEGHREDGLYKFCFPELGMYVAQSHAKNKVYNVANMIARESLGLFFIKHKTQVGSVIEGFVNQVKTQYDAKVRVVRSDKGTEILQETCLKLFLAEGIMHQRSVARVPQQNGRVERKHRHLVETARAMMLHAGLPK
ncbi:hypothetical protein RND81_11G093700 [Saponaria officinalis]|uniref:Integrase catalytic domain-containing protein n=1 Tax=Saponaria officinalis TaxID=3572 RepID=A0AAW1HIZ1_SAPOF